MKLTTEQILNIKEGDKITFTIYGSAGIYTRKVQAVLKNRFADTVRVDLMSFNVNKVGSGTGYTNVHPTQILEVK
jgi:hypothetical protein